MKAFFPADTSMYVCQTADHEPSRWLADGEVVQCLPLRSIGKPSPLTPAAATTTLLAMLRRATTCLGELKLLLALPSVRMGTADWADRAQHSGNAIFVLQAPAATAADWCVSILRVVAIVCNCGTRATERGANKATDACTASTIC